MSKEVLVPDVGDAKEVEVIEILVSVGDTVKANDSLVVLESEKASMEIPSPFAGKVASVAVKVGEQVDEGDLILEIEQAEAGQAAAPEQSPGDEGKQVEENKATDEPASDEGKEVDEKTTDEPTGDEGKQVENKKATDEPPREEQTTAGEKASTQAGKREQTSEVTVVVPDVGDAKEIVVTEILVKAGDTVSEKQSVLVLESEKASMEIPSPHAGVVDEVIVAEGDEVEEGDALIKMTVAPGIERPRPVEQPPSEPEKPAPEKTAEKAEKPAPEKTVEKAEKARPEEGEKPTASQRPTVHAGPAVRKQAREYGVDLDAVSGSGRQGRILKEDVQAYVKQSLSSTGGTTGIPPVPRVDFAKFGEIELRPLSRVRRTSARNLHRSWLNVPHVTQFDEADITDLEAFRKSQNEELASVDVKITPLAFIVRACVSALAKYPQFNASIDENYENLIIKKYYNIAIAVETEDGLMVPVLKDADKKGVVELARESASLAQMARDKKLPLDAMQGATFTISSLGGIGGTAFTPIVNAPEVAILGVSRSKVAPVFDGSEFRPRTILPLSLSYDHRAIDGAEAVRFTSYLSQVLSDVRRMLM